MGVPVRPRKRPSALCLFRKRRTGNNSRHMLLMRRWNIAPKLQYATCTRRAQRPKAAAWRSRAFKRFKSECQRFYLNHGSRISYNPESVAATLPLPDQPRRVIQSAFSIPNAAQLCGFVRARFRQAICLPWIESSDHDLSALPQHANCLGKLGTTSAPTFF